MSDRNIYPQAILPPNCQYLLREVNLDDVHLLHQYLWPERPIDDIDDFIKRVLKFKQQQRSIGIVVMDEMQLVAYGQTTLWMQCSEISDLMVSTTYRSQGIGTAMIQYLTQYAIKRRITCVELGVAESNPRALKLYQQLGFVESYKLELDLGDGREPVAYLSLDITPYH